MQALLIFCLFLTLLGGCSAQQEKSLEEIATLYIEKYEESTFQPSGIIRPLELENHRSYEEILNLPKQRMLPEGYSVRRTGRKARKRVGRSISHTLPLTTAMLSRETNTSSLVKQVHPSAANLSSWRSLKAPLTESLRYSLSRPQEEIVVQTKGIRILRKQIVDSLRELLTLLPHLDKNPQLLAEHFHWFRVDPSIRYTGYFTPIIRASMKKTGKFSVPLYRAPDTPSSYSREETDIQGALKDKGLELAYIEHIASAWMLMLQGQGILSFENGRMRSISYDCSNGQKGSTMIGWLIRHKELPSSATMDDVKKWWDTHPEKRRDLLTGCPGYVFFRWGDNNEQSAIGAPLVPYVSMATDPHLLPLGSILICDIPNKQKKLIGLAQDTGSAIRMQHIDVYTGSCTQGESRCAYVSGRGEAWLLLKK